MEHGVLREVALSAVFLLPYTHSISLAGWRAPKLQIGLFPLKRGTGHQAAARLSILF